MTWARQALLTGAVAVAGCVAYSTVIEREWWGTTRWQGRRRSRLLGTLRLAPPRRGRTITGM